MVVAVPQQMAERYGQWADKIPADVLADLTEAQVHGRLRKAQARWETAAGEGGEGGDGDLTKALSGAGEILAAPAPGAEPKTPSALKSVGVTLTTAPQRSGSARRDVLAVRGLGLIGLNDSRLRACLPRDQGGKGPDSTMFVSAFDAGWEGHESATYKVMETPHGPLFRGFRRMFDAVIDGAQRTV
ncbi:hypothetical protein [Streptomyces sp. NPDC058086]|uniref:hypothetical protein n=1 Tax=Streptomyces sp. NPDC058086 TaxID=3346334 RepID=UPI0036DFAEE7